jgi:hypothetical protein
MDDDYREKFRGAKGCWVCGGVRKTSNIFCGKHYDNWIVSARHARRDDRRYEIGEWSWNHPDQFRRVIGQPSALWFPYTMAS